MALTLQLCIEDALKLTPICRALRAAQRLVSHFNESILCTTALLDSQKADDNPPLYLVQRVAGRWTSNMFMMERLLKLKESVCSILYNENIVESSDRAILDISDANWKILENLFSILWIFHEAVEILEKDDLSTGSSICILVHDLMANQLQVRDVDTDIIGNFKEKLRSNMMKHFKVNEVGVPLASNLKSPFVTATFLDPRFKQLKLLSPSQRQIVHSNILSMLEKEVEAELDKESDTLIVKQEMDNEPPPTKKTLFSCLLGDICDVTNQKALDIELNDYINEPVRISNPLEWWKMYEKRFSSISKLARTYLSVPGTSLQNEKFFPVDEKPEGQTIAKLSSMVDLETLNEIVFINKNMKHKLTYQVGMAIFSD